MHKLITSTDIKPMFKRFLLACCSLVILNACSRVDSVKEVNSEEENGMVSQGSAKILTIGGAITEVVFALGAGDQIIATDQTSMYPEATDQIEKIGFVRSLTAEPVIAMGPDMILASPSAGPPDVITQIKSSGIPFHTIAYDTKLEGTKAMIAQVGDLLGKQTEAAALWASVEEDLNQLQTFLAVERKKPTVLFIYARGAGTLMVSGTGTAADEMIRIAGGTNAIASFEQYKPLTPEAVITANPDVILMLDDGIESVGGMAEVLKIPGVAQTPAGKAGRIVHMNDLYLLGFGPRLGKAALELAQHLYGQPISI
jgi:iron complex transport system substrate-binding protein